MPDGSVINLLTKIGQNLKSYLIPRIIRTEISLIHTEGYILPGKIGLNLISAYVY